MISIDAKKKEVVGNFKNPGQEWQPQGQPVPVEGHDFAQEKVNPFGVFELGAIAAGSMSAPIMTRWNKIEHRMFCHITRNWRGRPLVSHEVIVNLIAATTTTKGLFIQADLDRGSYPKGIKVSNQEMAQINLVADSFHGEWNYSICPTICEK